MVKPVMRDLLFLSRKSKTAQKTDSWIAQDLLDTLEANSSACVGMAANMIGQSKNIIVVNIGFRNMILYNPVIVKKTGPYQTEEGCLSLNGVRPVERYETISVEFQDIEWKHKTQTFTGWTSQIIQHEIDHLSGIII